MNAMNSSARTYRLSPRARRIVLLVNAIPFVVIALLVVRNQPQLGTVLPRTSITLPAPLHVVRAGVDRLGGQVAVLAGDCRVHLLREDHGALRERVLDVPLPRPTTRGYDVAFVDGLRDDRLDLRLVAVSSESEDAPSFTAEPDGLLFRPFRRDVRPQPVVMAGLPQTITSTTGAVFALRYSAEGDPLTRLYSTATGALSQVVRGVGLATADMDEGAGEELLTSEPEASNPTRVLYRLFRFEPTRLKEVWTTEGSQLPGGTTGPNYQKLLIIPMKLLTRLNC